MKKLTQSQIQEVIDSYLSGESSEKIAIKFGVSGTAIRSLLKRRGIACRNQSLAQRRYSLNEQAFEVITRDCAYWVGFLISDGCIINRSGNRGKAELRIKLSEKDKGHIEKLKQFLSTDAPIKLDESKGRYLGGNEAYYLTLYSQKLCESLKKQGLNEERILPQGVKYSPDFWRGVVDGDGYILSAKKSRVELVGDLLLLTQFLQFISTICPECCASVLPHKSIYRVQLSGLFAQVLIDCLYKDAPTYLERKNPFSPIGAALETL
ncbi:hypothetical protein [Nostoc commune]|uniref:hypothetical protein n=1 Tax=Nostoc commune TaxID=1178 RepID=UPI0018C68656|nr:hypothetical protein [Nostoc commune]MBG1260371.1 hypothetical protein [Nostoc commune BAE]